MLTRRSRLPLLVAGLLVAVLALSACGSGPSRVGAAAVVGDRVVPVELVGDRLRMAGPVLQSVVDARAQESGGPVGAPIPPAVLADRSRALLSIAVQHELITQASARAGITVPPTAVDDSIARSGGLEELGQSSGFDAGTIRELLTDGLALAEMGRRSFDGLAVTAQFVTLPDRARAEAFLARAAGGPETAGSAFAAVSAAPQLLRPDLVTSPEAPGGPDSVTSVAYGLPPGATALAPGSVDPAAAQAGRGQPWTVVHVLDRTTTAPPGGTPSAAAGSSTLAALGLQLLQMTALEQGVTISPRYGVWDPIQLAVVATPAEAGVVRTASPAPPATP